MCLGMRICFANHTMVLGSGIDHVTHNLANELALREVDTKGCGVGVIAMQTELMSPRHYWLHKATAPPFGRLGMVASPLWPPSVMSMRNWMGRYDIVLTQMHPSCLFPHLPTKINNTKHVFIEWGVQASNLFPKKQEMAYIGILRKAHGYAIQHADMVIAPAKAVAAQIKRDYGVDAVNMNLYGIDLGYFNRETSPKLVYKKYPQLEGRPVVLFAGRVSPHKNIDMLIDAFYLLRASLPDAKLLLVGRPSFPYYENELHDRVIKKGLVPHVVFAGLVPQEELPAYFAAASVFCVCSAWEGYLIPEPMAMGLPIVAYHTDVHAETVVNGLTGVLVNELTPYAFSRGLLEALQKREDLGENAYLTAKWKYDYKMIAIKLLGVLGQL